MDRNVFKFSGIKFDLVSKILSVDNNAARGSESFLGEIPDDFEDLLEEYERGYTFALDVPGGEVLSFLSFENLLEEEYNVNPEEVDGLEKVRRECLDRSTDYEKEIVPILQEYRKEEKSVKKSEEKRNLEEKYLDSIFNEYLKENHPEFKERLDTDPGEYREKYEPTGTTFALSQLYEGLIRGSPEFKEFKEQHPNYQKYKRETKPILKDSLRKMRLLAQDCEERLAPKIREMRNKNLEDLQKVLPEEIKERFAKDLEKYLPIRGKFENF